MTYVVYNYNDDGTSTDTNYFTTLEAAKEEKVFRQKTINKKFPHVHIARQERH